MSKHIVLSDDKQKDAVEVIDSISEHLKDMTTHASSKDWEAVSSTREIIQRKLKLLQVITCPHPAFDAGKCVLCDATYEEAGI